MILHLMLFVNTVFIACISPVSFLLFVLGYVILTIRYTKYLNTPVVYGQVFLFVTIYVKE